MFQKKYFLAYFLIFQIVLLQVLGFFPEFVETVYSNSIYQSISNFSRIIFGKIPFSIGDCMYGILIVWLIYSIYKNRKSTWKQKLLSIFSYFSIFYFLFHTLWAFNYYRIPLFEKMKIERDYSDADLLDFTKKLIAKTNQIQNQITKNDSLKVIFPYSHEQTFEMDLNGYQNLEKQYSFFDYENLSVKKSLFSLPLTYMGFGGYLNPFTNEAQVNYLMPIYNLPMTSNHEMAHQLGYGSESECNFIGFLASIKNDDLYFQYSGYSSALRYCLANWEARNPEVLKQLLPTINNGILKNYQESQDFWKQYETPIETGFKVFYDNFLKINQQEDGLESYSKFVNLMVGYYKTRDL
jgi:Protein of unknown function (DUF3810)